MPTPETVTPRQPVTEANGLVKWLLRDMTDVVADPEIVDDWRKTIAKIEAEARQAEHERVLALEKAALSLVDAASEVLFATRNQQLTQAAEGALASLDEAADKLGALVSAAAVAQQDTGQ